MRQLDNKTEASGKVHWTRGQRVGRSNTLHFLPLTWSRTFTRVCKASGGFNRTSCLCICRITDQFKIPELWPRPLTVGQVQTELLQSLVQMENKHQTSGSLLPRPDRGRRNGSYRGFERHCLRHAGRVLMLFFPKINTLIIAAIQLVSVCFLAYS